MKKLIMLLMLCAMLSGCSTISAVGGLVEAIGSDVSASADAIQVGMTK